MPDKRCLLCGRIVPADEYDGHVALHAQVGQVMVEVKGGKARPVYVRSIDEVEDLEKAAGGASERDDLLELAALAVGEGAQDGRYPATDELREYVYMLWPELRPS